MSSSTDAGTELKWFIAIVIAIGFIWIASGGLKSATKNSPVIKAVSGETASSTSSQKGSWFSFLFPWASGGNTTFGFTPTVNPTGGTHGQVYGYNQNGTGGGSSGNQSGGTYYGADNPPGPVVETKDSILIESVNPSGDEQGKADGEYIQISTPDTNKKKILLTGMLFKSRMTGNQASLGEGVNLYYSNTLNKAEPVFLAPGQTAYVITGKSPLGYSFRTNKCIGYLNNYYKNFIVPFSSRCPSIKSYPLPARPNAFKDNCLDFLDGIGSCQAFFEFPSDLADECRTFITDRATYQRCVADFSNDQNFLGNEWRVYLGRGDSLWKDRREIVDLIDQQGNIVSTYTY